MKIKKSDVNGFLCITLCGDMDAYDAENLETDAMDEIKKGARKIIIDLKDLRYISSSGLRVLLNMRSHLKKFDGTLILASLKDKVFEVFRVSKLLNLFEIVGDAGNVAGKE